MADKGGQPTSLSEAKRLGSPTYRPKRGRNKGKIIAAVSKEELTDSGMSLKEFLNKRRIDARKTGDIAGSVKTPKAKPRPAPKARVPAPKARVPAPKGDLSPSSQARKATPTPKRKIPATLRASSNADLSAPEIPKSKSKTPQDILGTREKSRARRRARQETKTKEDTSMTPEQKLKGQIGISAAAAALIGPAALPILMRVATKHGPAFARSLGNKIKNLTSGQQKNVAQAANKGKTKTEAEKLAKDSMRVFKGGKSLKRDRVEPYIAKASTPLTKGQSRASRTMDAARQNQRTEIDPGFTGGALKRGGQIKKYNKGGKVVKRKEGGQVMSGNDLVSSLYN